MCVILVANDTPVSANMIEQCNRVNADGIGVAWFNRGKVRWRKGIDVDRAMYLAGKLPRPYVMHFRWATVGDKCAELTHPFPVTERPRFDHYGYARQVLFHNGHVSEYRALATALGVSCDTLHSDTSIVSRCLAKLPLGRHRRVLEELGGRWVLMRDRSVKLIGKFVKVDGVLASNDNWKLPPKPVYTGRYRDFFNQELCLGR